MKKLLILALLTMVVTPPTGLVTKPSTYSVAETPDPSEAVVQAEKFQVIARVAFQSLAADNHWHSTIEVRTDEAIR